LGARVAGLSVLTNLAAGIAKHALSHEEVGLAGKEVQKKLVPLLRAFVRHLAD
jgi:purine-nucleoside phosphorylase